MRKIRSSFIFVLALITFAVFAGCADSQVEGDFEFRNLTVREQSPALVLVSFRLANQEDGAPQPNLTIDDFIIEEDSQPLSPTESRVRIVQRTRAFELETVIMLDFSASVVENEFDELIDAARTLAETLAHTSKIAVYYFDGRDSPFLIADFDDSSPGERIEEFRNHSIIDPSTNLRGAISEGLRILDRRRAEFAREARELDQTGLYGGSLVLFTDGQHTAGTGPNYPSEPQTLRDVDTSDHAIFTVGVDGESDIEFLEKVGRDGFEVADPRGNLAEAFNRLTDSINDFANSYYTVAYCSPLRTGRHELSINIKGREGLEGTARISFDADDFSAGCSESLIDDLFPAEEN